MAAPQLTAPADLNKAPAATPLTTIGGTTQAQAKAGYAPAQQALAQTTTASNALTLSEAQAVALQTATNNQGKGGGGGGNDGALNANTDALNALLAAQNKANTTALQSAYQTLVDTLSSYGFTPAQLTGPNGLATQAWTEMQAGTPSAQILLNIQSSSTFQKMFPGIQTRNTKGLPPITPAEYLSTKDAMTQTLNEAGISPSSVNLDNMIGLDVSPTELSNRIQQGYLAVSLAPQDVISAMQNYYGVTKGQLVQYFTDPTKNGPLLLQQAAAAQIGGAATGSGFMGKNAQSTTPAISQALALQLAQQGVTYQQAQTGFGQLATQSQLYNPLPGQGQVRGNGGAPYTASQLAEAQFFGGPAEQALQLQAQTEQAYFKSGTNVGTSGAQTGLGNLQR